jgi:uncharacterized lipoprotein YddW (UPF0748 family)
MAISSGLSKTCCEPHHISQLGLPPSLLFDSTRLVTPLFRALALGIWSLELGASAAAYVPSKQVPPPVAREFRGAWVATVGNIDWPSKPGLTTQQQKAELLSILDRAADLRLNAVILQVRPGCDALYASPFEPWSEYLTGTMGQAPKPFYDPLAFAVEEAHKRGLELHAWFNPFRARHLSARSPIAAGHISKTRPELVRQYGKLLWLDPGEQAVQNHSFKVILDVLRRYDIDGVHLDDYFYPYRIRDDSGQPVPFNDAASWKRYLSAGGKLDREDWRRQNIDRFVERLYVAVKAEKPFVKFGISPPGIWRPGNPPQIEGHDAYAFIYADSRKWLHNGWLDYLAPQLYWDIQPPAQSYPVLLKWWTEQNPRNRYVWAGNDVSRIGGRRRTVEEIVNQIGITRQTAGATGNILWNFKPLLQNRSGINDALKERIFSQPALPPAVTWSDRVAPPAPVLSVGKGNLQFSWSAAATEPVRWWLVRTKDHNVWSLQIVDGRRRSVTTTNSPAAVAIAAVDRAGNIGPYTVLEKAAQKSVTKTTPRPSQKRTPKKYLPPKMKS